jgi:hypothetical protein
LAIEDKGANAMRRTTMTILTAAIGLAACNKPADSNTAAIKVTSADQQKLHTLSAYDLSIALKRAIFDAGYRCTRVTDAGFVGNYENLDMWVARCVAQDKSERDWAVFTGPDGSAQVRDCKDVPGSGLPECKIGERPNGSFEKPN